MEKAGKDGNEGNWKDQNGMGKENTQSFLFPLESFL
jgi:hypothetical protein